MLTGTTLDLTPFGVILKGIGVFYWAVVFTLLALVLIKVRGTFAKLASAVAVITIMIGPLALHLSNGLKRQKQYEESCSRAGLKAEILEAVPGYYLDHEAFGDGGFNIYFGAIVRYMIENKMSYLEMDNIVTKGIRDTSEFAQYHFFEAVETPQMDNKDMPFVRFRLANQSDGKCLQFNSWLTKYPAQKLPWIRKNGLKPDQCIAVDGVDQLQSRYRVKAKLSPVLVNENHNGLYEHFFWIDDFYNHKKVAELQASVEHDMYSNRNVLCGKKDDYAKFQKLLNFVPDKSYKKYQEETNDSPADFPVIKPASIKDVTIYSSSVPDLKNYVTNLISKDGLVSFETSYVRTDANGSFSLSGYYLVTINDEYFRKTLIVLNGVNVQNFTGLVVNRDGVKFIALSRDRSEQWLLEYSTSGKPLKALSLSAEQYDSIKNNILGK
jgi:hypothetical protein